MTAPASRVETLRAYQRAPLPASVTLRLDANEGQPAAAELILAAIQEGGTELFRRYPDARPLETRLAARFDVEPEQVFVSAGADDVIDRCCRAYLAPGSSLLIAEPGFEMFDHYAALCGARVMKVTWPPGAYPIDAMLSRIDQDSDSRFPIPDSRPAIPQTRVIALVTPNNPTGEVATGDDLRRLAQAAPDALVILDHAYADFADTDLTATALAMPNVVVVRTFSKAWGLAGCRVGYALGPAPVIRSLRAAGGPFPVSAPSLAVAAALLERGQPVRDAFVRRVREERMVLHELLATLGGQPRQSQGNFVFAEAGHRSAQVHARLVEQGVLVRTITSGGVPLGLRIALPGDPREFDQLKSTVERAFRGNER